MRITFEKACKRFPNRFTMEHVPSWATSMRNIKGKYYAPQYKTDREWYASTDFHDNMRTCQSHDQTWPLGQFLDEPYRRKT